MTILVLLAALTVGQQPLQSATTTNAPVYQIYQVRNEYYIVQVRQQIDYGPVLGWALFADDWNRDRDRHRYERRRWFQR